MEEVNKEVKVIVRDKSKSSEEIKIYSLFDRISNLLAEVNECDMYIKSYNIFKLYRSLHYFRQLLFDYSDKIETNNTNDSPEIAKNFITHLTNYAIDAEKAYIDALSELSLDEFELYKKYVEALYLSDLENSLDDIDNYCN